MKSLKEKLNKLFDDNTIAETSSTGTTGNNIIYAPFNELVDDILEATKNPKTFEEAVEPLMKWLCENKHPHTSVIVTGIRAELVDGLQCHSTDEFVVD